MIGQQVPLATEVKQRLQRMVVPEQPKQVTSALDTGVL